MRRRFQVQALLIALLALFSVAPAGAQNPGYVTTSNETGFPDYGSFIASQIDSVNLSNGGLSLRIPIYGRKSRGLDYSWGYRYDSKFWIVDVYRVMAPWGGEVTRLRWIPDIDNSIWKWGPNFETWGVSWTEQVYECPDPYPRNPPAVVLYKSNWTYSSPDATKHQFPARNRFLLSNTPDWCITVYPPDVNSLKTHAQSGHLELDITADTAFYSYSTKFRAKDGSSPGGYGTGFLYRDTNGNRVGGGDTLGRGYQFYTPDGQVNNIQTETQWLTLNTSFPTSWGFPTDCDFDQSTNAQIIVVRKITLPNGLSYNFAYNTWWDSQNPTAQNPYGEVTQITLPTGGYIKYKWATIAQMDVGPDAGVGCMPDLDARVLVERRVSEDGQTESVWQYSYNLGFNGGTTTVTDPEGNVEVHTFIGFEDGRKRLETQVEYRNTSGTPLRRVNTTWASDTGPVTFHQPTYLPPGGESSVALGPRNFRVTSRTTTLLDVSPNLVSKTETDYNDCFNYVVLIQSYTDCRENPTEVREYDWGSGTPGALVRKTTFSYLHQSNTTYRNAHFWNLLTEKKVLDAGGNVKAWTQFSYDTTAITPTSGVPQHDYTSHPSTNTVRGNQTLIKRWRNTDGAWLTTTNKFNDVGNLIETTDPGGHTTTFSYADNYTDGVNRNSQGYVTQITYPTTNGVAHVEKKQYYFHTGAVAAACGQNFSGNCVNTLTPPQPDYSKFTYDAMGRPLTVVMADGGQNTFAYNEPVTPSPSNPITVSATTKINATQNLTSSAVIDGLGRVKQTKLTSDPQGTVFTDTTFDGLGRKLTVTNPYRSTSDPTYGITKFKYDALGRVTRVIPPDGNEGADTNVVKTDYAGNMVTVTDQAGKQRRSFTDGLGRLTMVHEPGNGEIGASPATPGTGWVDITGTEGYYQDAQWIEQCELYDESGYCLQWGGYWQYTDYWDNGGVSVTVNGLTKQVSYGQFSTGANLAVALANAINADSGYPVNATASGIRLTLTAKTSGAATNYLLSATSWTNDPQHFGSGSFFPVRSGPTLTGGADAVQGSSGSGPLLLSTPAVTSYTYDVLDNLLSVLQSNSRPRSFSYNSLSQLLTASNPESGTIGYAYDSDGNLITKTDARGITICYGDWGGSSCNGATGYDALHRLLKKTYSNGDPAATFIYDVSSVDGLSIQYPKGRLVKSAQGSTRNVSSFDVGGRVLTNWQCTPLNCGSGWFTLTYAYNLIGGMTSYTDGVGHTFTQQFNDAGRVTQLTSSLTGPTYPATLASNFSYNAAGAVEYMKFGNNLYHRVDMNNRLQPCRYRVTSAATAAVLCSATDPTGDTLQMKYSYNHGTANNGNVMSWAANGAQSFSRDYIYDELNRLKAMTSTGASCTALEWTYDIWANRTNQNLGPGGAACGTHHPTINVKNQIVDTGYVYDAAGNMTQEPGKTYQYDAEGRLVSLNNGCAGSGPCYVYDANGRRVRKVASGVTTEYIYGAGGVVAEKVGSTWTVGYVYLNGQLLAQYKNGTTYFAHKDHLGSTRLLTKPDGSYDSADVYDYLPYGEPVGSTATTTSHKFTGQERDSESGLDYFGARHFASFSGRFLQPDPLLNAGRPWMPQTWNRFTYVLNNPLNFVDPLGLYEFAPSGCSNGDEKCEKQYKENKEKFEQALKALKRARDSFGKKSREYKRLDAALSAYGEKDKKDGVTIVFGKLAGKAAGRTDPLGDLKSFTVTFDPAKWDTGQDGSKLLASDVGHEGTHLADLRRMFAGAEVLSDFSIEYRGYETSAFVFQALFTPALSTTSGTTFGGIVSKTLLYGGSVVWNSSWSDADKKAIQARDTGITNAVKSIYGHSETNPHNPWKD